MTVWVLVAEGPHNSFVLGVYDDFEKARRAKDSCYMNILNLHIHVLSQYSSWPAVK